MLHAVLSGKAARVSVDGEKHSWRELFRTREDLITASVFGRLPYLSDHSIRGIMTSLLSFDRATESLGEYQNLKFWPQYDDPANAKSYVEPDALLTFANATILLEVKPPWTDQKYNQWYSEVDALINDGLDQEKPLYFLALGGATDSWQEEAKKLQCEQAFAAVKLRAITCTWRKLCDAISHVQTTVCEQSRDARILEDQLRALMLHGIYRAPKPMSDLLKNGWQFDLNALDNWHNCQSAQKPDWNSINKIAFLGSGELSTWPQPKTM